MRNSYELTESQSKLYEAFIKDLEKAGIKVGKPISIRMRDCNDVPEFIKRVEEAHEETGNSTLRFKRADGLVVCLAWFKKFTFLFLILPWH